METKEVKVCVEGISPLIMNRFNPLDISSDPKKRAGAVKKGDINNKLYIFDDKYYIPAVYFRNTLINSAKQFKIQGKGKSTYSKLIGSVVDVNPEMILLSHQDFEEFSIAAVNPMTKGRIMVTRPRFNLWGCEFVIRINDDGVPVHVINEILSYAGRYVGVGDWRPEKKGMFGKFIVTSFKEVV
jgi:hypothetical protein